MPRTTDSNPARCLPPNRLLAQSAPTTPNQVRVGDITYLPWQGSGELYLAVWLDRCSRKIVSWDVRDTKPEDLVSEALRHALVVRRPAAGLLSTFRPEQPVHGHPLPGLLAWHGAVQSTSRRANCYDNAHTESSWSRFKAE